jgi:hypothetical protein
MKELSSSLCVCVWNLDFFLGARNSKLMPKFWVAIRCESFWVEVVGKHMATDTAAHLPPTDLTTLTWGGVGLGWVELSWVEGVWGSISLFGIFHNINPCFCFILFYFMFSLKHFLPKHFIQIKLIHQWYQFYFSRIEAQISSTNQRSTSLFHPFLHPFLLCCLGLVPIFLKGESFWCQFTEEHSKLATSCTNRYSSGTILVSFIWVPLVPWPFQHMCVK